MATMTTQEMWETYNPTADALRTLKAGAPVRFTCANRGEREGWYGEVKPDGETRVWFEGFEPWSQTYGVPSVVAVLGALMRGEAAPPFRHFDSCLRYAQA